jgi:hypothetical protein
MELNHTPPPLQGHEYGHAAAKVGRGVSTQEV